VILSEVKTAVNTEFGSVFICYVSLFLLPEAMIYSAADSNNE